MGAWATGSFDNDDATDWIATLMEHGDMGFVHETIADLLAVDGYIEASQAACALAAIETLAAALGRPTPVAQANENLAHWLAGSHPIADPTMTADALVAIDRIMGRQSELCELWKESASFDEWQSRVATLRGRLQT